MKGMWEAYSYCRYLPPASERPYVGALRKYRRDTVNPKARIVVARVSRHGVQGFQPKIDLEFTQGLKVYGLGVLLGTLAICIGRVEGSLVSS